MDPAIKMVEEKLEVLSSDPDTLALYKAREDAAYERANLIHTGIQKGIEQGIQTRNIEVAVNLLDVLDNQIISEKTGLPIERIQQLRNDSIK